MKYFHQAYNSDTWQFSYQEYCSIFYYPIERALQKTVYNNVFYSLETIYEKYNKSIHRESLQLLSIIHLCQINFLSWIEKGHDAGAMIQT